MPNTTITVKSAEPPREGKKNAIVIDSVNKQWLVPPNLFDCFTVGADVRVEYYTSDFKGHTYFFVKNARPIEELTSAGEKDTSQTYSVFITVLHELTEVLRETNKLIKSLGDKKTSDDTPTDRVPF